MKRPMTHQPSQSVDEVAKGYASKVSRKYKDGEPYPYEVCPVIDPDEYDAFIAGHHYTMQSAQVKGLVDTLERISKQDRIRGYPIGSEGIDIVDEVTHALKQFKGE